MSETGFKQRRGSRQANRYSRQTMSVPRIITLLAGLMLLVLAMPPFFSFPWLKFWLVPLAAIYFLVLLLFPRSWLIILPLATVGFDLTPWTGRFSYNELDLLFLVTISSALIFGRYRFKVFSVDWTVIVMFLYLGVIALGYTGWAMFVLPPQAISDNPYYTNEYAYKVFKGMLWGVSLVPMWGYHLALNKQKAVNFLVLGMSLAAVLLGLIVLWERGTLGIILTWPAWYHIVSSFLDLSSSYRVTGVFSDMHTGGEVIDGVLLLLLPITCYGIAYGKKVWLRSLAVLAFLALAYVTLVGFTRATYAAFAISLALYAVLSLWSRYRLGLSPLLPLARLIATLGVELVAAVIAFKAAGSVGLACFGALLLLAYGDKLVLRVGRHRYVATAIAVLLVGVAVSAHFSSRWAEPSLIAAVFMSGGLGLGYFLFLLLLRETGELTVFNRLLLVGATFALPAIAAFALGGSQINARVSHVASDLETRQNHWANVQSSSGDGVFVGLFGNGVGSFPTRYIDAHSQRVRDVGSFSVIRDKHRVMLQLGGGHDLTVGQRLAIQPYTTYTVALHLRAEQAGRVTVALCERNLIFASNFMPRCVRESISFTKTKKAVEDYSLEINSGQVGERGALWRWPTVLTIHYGTADTLLEIDSIEISANGFNLLRNSSFKSGLDYWFYYNDFSHLPWHVKNTFLQVWFESGWLGLGLFLVLLGLVLRSNYFHHSLDSLAPVYTTGVIAVCVFGLFGSPLDSARVSWMFYFFLFSSLSQLKLNRRTANRVSHKGLH